MPHDELLALLTRARAVLEHYLFESDEAIRDDVAEVCMAIDEALPPTLPAPERHVAPERVPRIYAVRGITR